MIKERLNKLWWPTGEELAFQVQVSKVYYQLLQLLFSSNTSFTYHPSSISMLINFAYSPLNFFYCWSLLLIFIPLKIHILALFLCHLFNSVLSTFHCIFPFLLQSSKLKCHFLNFKIISQKVCVGELVMMGTFNFTVSTTWFAWFILWKGNNI